MITTVLTKSGGFLGTIANLLGLIMNGIYDFFSIFGIQNIALTIIIFTFITKTLMLPLTIKQQKFTKLSSRMNPELQKIQAKYKGKKDEASLRKQQAETQAVYQKYGASPTSGCLPMLLTLPIMFALFRVINNIPAYVNDVRDLYEAIAIAIQNTDGYIEIMTETAKSVNMNNVTDFSNNHIIDILARLRTDQWNVLKESFPNIQQVINENLVHIHNANNFFGMNIANKPGWGFPGILIPILAMAFQFVQSKQLDLKNKGTNNADNPTANAMSSMNVAMPIMSGVFAITLPIGVGLYWIATSVFAIIQQFFVNKYMDKVDIEELIEKSVSKANKRNSRISSGAGLQEIAKKQTKSLENIHSEKVTGLEDVDNEKNVNTDDKVQKGTNYNPTSISEIANLLKNRNGEKGDK